MKRRLYVVVVCVSALWVARFAYSTNPNIPFSSAITGIDKIVVRNGGHDCCNNDVDAQDVFVEITAPNDIANLLQNIDFKRRYPPLLYAVGMCRCCGYPGIDYYRGGERVALTSVQHGFAIRWSGFETDEELTDHSIRWLAEFLRSHGVPEQQIGQSPKITEPDANKFTSETT